MKTLTDFKKLPAEYYTKQGYKTKKDGATDAYNKHFGREQLAKTLNEIAKNDNKHTIDRFMTTKRRVATSLAVIHSLPTSSPNACYSGISGSTTITTYSRSSQWSPSVARDTYVYFENRQLCFETGRGRKGKTNIVIRPEHRYNQIITDRNIMRKIFLSDTQYAINLGQQTIAEHNGNLYELIGESGKQTLAFLFDNNVEHGISLHKIKREIQHKQIVKIRESREKEINKQIDRKANLILRLVKNASFPVYYTDARKAGYCEAGLKSFFSVYAPDLLNIEVAPYSRVRKLLESPEKNKVEKILLTAIRRELTA